MTPDRTVAIPAPHVPHGPKGIPEHETHHCDQQGPTHGQSTDADHPERSGADMNNHAITTFAAMYLVTVLCLTAVALVWLALRPDNWLDQRGDDHE